MLDIGTFVSIIIPLFVGGLFIAGQALVTRTRLHSLEKKVDQNQADARAEIEKVKLDETQSRVALTDALARLNSVLNDFKVQFSEAKSMYNRQDEILGELKNGFIDFKKEIKIELGELKDDIEGLKNVRHSGLVKRK